MEAALLHIYNSAPTDVKVVEVKHRAVFIALIFLLLAHILPDLQQGTVFLASVLTGFDTSSMLPRKHLLLALVLVALISAVSLARVFVLFFVDYAKLSLA